jgi:hypothetical protein
VDSLLSLFTNNLLPIFLAAGTGYLLGKTTQLDAKTLSRVVFYIFSPCLVFDLLTTSQLTSGDLARMAGFVLVLAMVVGGLTWLAGRVLKFSRSMLVATILAATLPNAGNYGLSLNLFTYGEDALAHASLFFVTSAILSYTLGVFIASLGKAKIRDAFIGLFKIPVVYAVLLALVLVRQGTALPLPIERTTSVLADAAIPSMLVLLGLLLQRAEWTGQWRELLVANGMRLVVSPAIAIGLAIVFGLTGAAYQAGITEAAMPSAVMTTVLATEFDVEPVFVTLAVFTSTILSPLTVTPLLAFLGG